MVSTDIVAKYLLHLSDPEDGNITNLKLQELCYYAQGYHLAVEGEPLFEETIEAWDHGPVVPELYREYRRYGSGPIDFPASLDLGEFTAEQLTILDEVWENYGQYTGWKLRDMTHDERPWKETPNLSTISHDLMREYFETTTESEDFQDALLTIAAGLDAANIDIDELEKIQLSDICPQQRS